MEGASRGIEWLGEREFAAAAHGSSSPNDLVWLRSTLDVCVKHLPVGVQRATVEIVSDARMCALHRAFSGSDTTTDVLTFASNAPGQPVDCDIAVCAPEAARRAQELGHTTAQELLLYALHGLLHACGMDDLDPASHAAMHAEEDRILTAVGVGPLFARPKGQPKGEPKTESSGESRGEQC